MKKVLFSVIAMIGMASAAQAQFKVHSSGNLSIGGTLEASDALVFMGNRTPMVYNGYAYSLQSKWANSPNTYNIGISSAVLSANVYSSGRSIGVSGVAGCSTSGYNYGVLGGVFGPNNGAGIFGTVDNHTGVYINGKYAGYFDGEVKVTSSVTATNFLTSSDMRLKENVKPLANRSGQTALNNIMDMNVVEYNYKRIEETREGGDTLNMRNTDGSLYSQKHIGLIAQELQELYPELVLEGQDGYLRVNYMELIPVLIQSIQDLKKELDEVRDPDSDARRAPTEIRQTETQAHHESKAELYQNTPNPFSERTEIRFYLPEDAHDAAICIFDMTGKMMKKMPVSSGETSVSVNGWELGEGLFLYSLVVGGQEIDTKRMILSK